MNFDNDQTFERNATPRLAVTVAGHFAYTRQQHDFVILIDTSSYVYALREVSTARVEVLGRNGYPAYMHTDFSMIYEGLAVSKPLGEVWHRQGHDERGQPERVRPDVC